MMYNKILLKLSGESIGGDKGIGFSTDIMKQYAKEIAEVSKKGVKVAIVIGGGNIFRGVSGVGKGFSRVKGDQMGMLATVINSIALQMFIQDEGVDTEVFSSVPLEPMTRYYAKEKVDSLLNSGGVAIIAGGTGNPFFTTDSASALRACEIGADALLKGTRVDGVYTADPEKDPNAKRYDTVSFSKALSDNLKVMDMTAFALCKENNMPIVVFDMNRQGNLLKLISGERVGTLVSND